jgi:hypothetical protein
MAERQNGRRQTTITLLISSIDLSDFLYSYRYFPNFIELNVVIEYCSYSFMSSTYLIWVYHIPIYF